MRVKVIDLAWDGTRRLRPGEIVDLPDNFPKGSWYEVLSSEPVEKPEPVKTGKGSSGKEPS
jgi:hypothetical protein